MPANKSPAKRSLPRYKVVMLGDSGCGKSQLLGAARAPSGVRKSIETLDAHVPTLLQTSTLRAACKKTPTRETQVELVVWEVGGAEAAKALLPLALEDAQAVALCYSASSFESLDNAEYKWARAARRLRPDLPLLLVGCKADLKLRSHRREHRGSLQSCDSSTSSSSDVSSPLRSEQLVARAEAEHVARALRVQLKQCSCTKPDSVSAVFSHLAALALDPAPRAAKPTK